MRVPAHLLRILVLACALPFAGSCGGASAGAVLVIDTELCEMGDGTGPAEWTQIVVTINDDQTFCASLDRDNTPEGCEPIGQGSFPLVLPIESSSGVGEVAVQIEVFAAAGDADPVACETSTLPLDPELVNWWFAEVQRPCDLTGVCTANSLVQMPAVRTIADLPPRIACEAPEPPPTLPIQRVAAGARHACLIDAGGDVYCWGANESSQLGRPEAVTNRPRPVTFTQAGARAIDLSLGDSHSCALTDDGGRMLVQCWGNNAEGQLGRGMTSDMTSRIPTPVRGSDDAVAISVGSQHGCLLAADGEVRCWGLNDFGQTGQSPGAPTTMATAVSLGDETALAVAAGGSLLNAAHHSCALTETEMGVPNAWCWGANTSMQLGHSMGPAPSPLEMPPNLVQLSIDGRRSCGTNAAGQLVCWGLNQAPGTLGVNTAMDTPVMDPITSPSMTPVAGPLAAPAGPPLATFSASEGYACFIAATDSLPYCFGLNSGGRLGSASPPTSMPVAVDIDPSVGFDRFQQITTGEEFACALPADGSMPVCWGRNQNGQRGIGTTAEPPGGTSVTRCD